MRTNKIKIGGLLIAVMALVGCTSATVTEPSACDTLMLGSIPASPVGGVALPPVTFSSNFDFSGVISKVKAVSDNITTNVNQLTMDNNGDLNWVSQVDVSIQAPGMQSVPFAQYKSNGDPGAEVALNILMDSGTMLAYLSQPITLTFTVQGTAPTQAVTFTNTMCVSVSGQFNKSL